MMVMQRNNLTYYFKEESVTLEIPHSPPLGNSYVSFNCYSMQSRKKFKKFRQVLQESGDNEYSSLNDVYGLASRYGIRPTSGHKPTIIDTLAF